MADRLRQIGDGPAGPRVGLDDEDLVVTHQVLDVDKPPHPDRLGEADTVVEEGALNPWIQPYGGGDAGAISGVDAGTLDMLHDPSHHHEFTVRDRVDVHLTGPLDEVVNQDRGRFREFGVYLLEVALKLFTVPDDLHSAPSEDVAGPDHDGVADLGREGLGIVGPVGRAAPRLGDA